MLPGCMSGCCTPDAMTLSPICQCGVPTSGKGADIPQSGVGDWHWPDRTCSGFLSIRPALDPSRNCVGCLSSSPDLFHMLRSCLNTVSVLRQMMSRMYQLLHLHLIISPSSTALYLHPSTRPFYQWPSRTLYCCIIVNSGCSFSRIRFHPSGR